MGNISVSWTKFIFHFDLARSYRFSHQVQ